MASASHKSMWSSTTFYIIMALAVRNLGVMASVLASVAVAGDVHTSVVCA
jgi:hypothetical protein